MFSAGCLDFVGSRRVDLFCFFSGGLVLKGLRVFAQGGFGRLELVGLAYWFVSRVGAQGAVAGVYVIFFAIPSGWRVKAWFWEFVRSRSAWLDLTGFHNCW